MKKKLLISISIILIITFIIILAYLLIPRAFTEEEDVDLPILSDEEFITYIIQDYTVLSDPFLKNYVDTTFPTNEFVIDKLSVYDNVKEINKLGEHTYEVYVDDSVLSVSLTVENNKIKKILVKEE